MVLCSCAAEGFLPKVQQRRPGHSAHGLPRSGNFSAHTSASLQPAKAPPQRLGQQQTSSVGEKYSGLASNLAHLGRIC